MVAPLPVAGVIKIDLSKTDGVSNWSESFYASNETGDAWTLADINEVESAVDTAYISHFKLLFPPSVELTNITVTDLTSMTGIQDVFEAAQVGTAAATGPCSISNAVRTTFLEPIRYRGGKPGVFCGGFQSSDLLTPIHWQATTVEAVDFAWEQMIEAVNGAPLAGGRHPTVVAVHRELHDLTLEPPTTYPVTSTETQTRICSQRRRLGRRSAG
jgi:hypothetical protein